MSPLLLTGVFIATVAVALLAFEAGLRLGRWRGRQPDPEPQQPILTLVASILSLCAFILGFTFGLASSHSDARSQAIFDEAVAISTAYRRAELLPDPERSNVRRLLRDYVDLRLNAGRSVDNRDASEQLRQLQTEIWTESVTASRHAVERSALPLIQSVADVIDVHAARVLAGIRSRIPFTVWAVMYSIMAIAVSAAGYQAGLAGGRRSLAAVFYALVFGAVIMMIAAADVPGSEQIRASHQALIDLRSRLTAP
jgi:hypothetical protein